jgi:hypothetical protein
MNNMKKVTLLVVLAILLGGVVAYAVPDPANDGIIKRVIGKSQDTPTRVYQLCRYAARGANIGSISTNEVVAWDTNSDDGVTIGVTTTNTSGTSCNNAIAGVAVTAFETANSDSTSAADDAGRRNWGYIQVYGPGTAKVIAGGTNAHAVGDLIFTSKRSGAAMAAEAYTGGVNTFLKRPLGFFLDADDSTSATVDVFIAVE